MSYGPGWESIKRSIRARDKVCNECGKTPEQNGRALDVHHIIPFRISGDNSPENLRALCRSCHMRIPDLGRRESARFLRGPSLPKPPTRRKIRELKASLRNAERTAKRREYQALATAMTHQGKSLREIAKALGVSHQTVANWLKGSFRVEEPGGAYGARQPADAA